MTPEDAVRALVHRYADAVCRRDTEQWLSCWATDGQWDLFSRSLKGHDELAPFFRRAVSRYEAVVQLVHNGVADLDDGSGVGCWYISEHAKQAGADGSLLLARYDDRYTCVDGKWLFARRTLIVHYAGPADLSAPFAPSPSA